MSGHVFAATAAPRDAFTLTESAGLRWYRSSPTSRRGFCGDCGSSLFFDHGDSESMGIAAGSFDGELPVTLAAHIYVDDAAAIIQSTMLSSSSMPADGRTVDGPGFVVADECHRQVGSQSIDIRAATPPQTP
ncbi:MAG: GFA family protein [Geminicoccaceae bacterium]